jgi:glycosyltransferase involved in cell wall biosynthesis
MARLLRFRPSLLYTLTVRPNVWGRLFGRIARIPAVVSGYRSLYPRQLERRLWPLSSRIICNAKVLKDVMVHKLSVDPGRIAVIPNAADTEFFFPDTDQKSMEPTVLFVGRLVKEKAPMDLLKAFTILQKKLPEARLEIVGNGPLSNQLETLIRSQSLESRARLIPATRDIRPFLNRAWVFAMASAQEASPNVIIEAMAAGLPVVATRVGGIPELVVDEQTGILVEPGIPQALSEALIDIFTNETKRQAMGLKSRERVLANYTLEKMVRQTENVFIEAMDDDSYRG